MDRSDRRAHRRRRSDRGALSPRGLGPGGGVRDELPRRLRHDLQPDTRGFRRPAADHQRRRRRSWRAPPALRWTRSTTRSSSRTSDSITVYSLTANGDVAPLRTISGADTELAQPIGLAVDTREQRGAGRELSSSITVYSRTAGGHLWQHVPLRTISGPSTRLLNPAGLAVDAVNDEILVANIGSVSGPGHQGYPGLITVYSRLADGERRAAPNHQRTGHGVGCTRGLAVDTVNDEVLVVNSAARSRRAPRPPSITVYNRTASGNVKPSCEPSAET